MVRYCACAIDEYFDMYQETFNVKRMVIFIGLLVMLAGCGPEKTKSITSTTKVNMMVTGFACPFCANKLDKQMYKITSVQDVIIDLGTGMVEVVVDESNVPSRAAIEQAVEDAGFTLESVSFPELKITD